MIDDLVKAISSSIKEVRSQQTKQDIQIKTGFQLVEQLSNKLDRKFSLEVKGNIVTRNQFEEFSIRSLDQTSQILEKISKPRDNKQIEKLDYFKELHSEILRRISKLEEKQLRISDKLPCKQDIIDLTSKLDTTQPNVIETETRDLVESLKFEVDRIKQHSIQVKEELDNKLQKIEVLLEEVKKLANGE